MAKKMFIDASHREELRMAIVDGQRLEDFEIESLSKRPLKGNIYLAKVMRIEPSLQAAFVDFGGNRQGFLSFNEIHPDYFQIPVSDRAALKEEEARIAKEADTEDGEDEPDLEEEAPRKRAFRHRYKIQEVIKRRQVMLVQVVREERGGKGAALTTYLSLAGRYCVLMPNSGERRGGISRKISDAKVRARIRKILQDLDIPDTMSLIVRTAGSDKTKAEIKRDFEYLLKCWSDARETTLKSIAPALINTEGDLITRALRDTYNKDIDEILIEGDDAYKAAKNLMRTMMPSHAKKVQPYKDSTISLFQKYRIESQIDQIFQPSVSLPSGGSIVIAQTEALVAIDVNSGKSTKERHIDDTALKTNLEAAKEVARQLRLRDLAGLIVIDFIDMNDNHSKVENALKDALKKDRARVQQGKISQFGLLEMSRQRLRPSVIEKNTAPCSHCLGTGFVRSIESMALFVLRQLESTVMTHSHHGLQAYVPEGVDLYLLNHKRQELTELEKKYQSIIAIYRDVKLQNTEYRIETQKLVGVESKEESFEELIEKENQSTSLQNRAKTPPRLQEKLSPPPQKAESLEEETTSIDAPKKESKNKRRRNRRKDKTRKISELIAAEISTGEPILETQLPQKEVQEESQKEGILKEKTEEGKDSSQQESVRKDKRKRHRFRNRKRVSSPSEGLQASESPQGGEETSPAIPMPPSPREEVEKKLPQEEDKKSPSSKTRRPTKSKETSEEPSSLKKTKEKNALQPANTQGDEEEKPRGWWKRLLE